MFDRTVDMSTKHISLRLDADVLQRLDERGARTGRNRPHLVNRFVDEGLRMDDHPGIVFRSGPAGRRAALAAGPDVWEVIRVVKNVEATGEQAVTEAAEWLGLARELVDIAVRYYSAFPDEIDAWIARIDADAAAAQAEWERRQAALS